MKSAFVNSLSILLFVAAAKPTEAAYDPEVGRWLARDPIGENAGINLYSYVYNNPIFFTDAVGLHAYVFFDAAGGPSGAESAGHVGVGVDNQTAGVTRADAGYGVVHTSEQPWSEAVTGDDLMVILPNHRLPSGKMSDDVIRDFLIQEKGSGYTYCSTYAAEAIKLGGWNAGLGLTPGSLIGVLRAMSNTPDGYDLDPTKLGMPTQPITAAGPGSPPKPLFKQISQ